MGWSRLAKNRATLFISMDHVACHSARRCPPAPNQTFIIMAPVPQPFITTVPEGTKPGDEFCFRDACGIEQKSVVPEGAEAGQTITVMVCAPAWVDINVPIPESSKVGEEF